MHHPHSAPPTTIHQHNIYINKSTTSAVSVVGVYPTLRSADILIITLSRKQ